MAEILSKRKIDYVLYHLNYHFQVSEEIRQKFQFREANSTDHIEKNKIVFQLSIDNFNDKELISIENIPVLFPLEKSQDIFRWENDSIVFNHDFLNSAFYLLSGEQEVNAQHRDRYSRFPFEGSVQQKLRIANVPVVNYYFEFISRGIKEYCKKYEILFRENRLFQNLGFILSHDVDIVDTYTFHDLIFKFKQLSGLAKSKYTFAKRLNFFLKYLLNYLNLFNTTNPHWDFQYLVESAKKRNFKSVFYFLHKDLKHQDSYYEFKEKRFKKLFQFLIDTGCEIGLHGSIRSVLQQEILEDHLKKLKQYSAYQVKGIRQHRLIHQHASTAEMQRKAGFQYDASLGFAEHIGFRNSFCYPFKLYDFNNEKIVDLWQIPLIVMDATLYMYADKLPEKDEIFKLIDECKKFNGLFTLLWHNGNFDRENYPGARGFYEDILDYLSEQQLTSLRANELISDYVELIIF